MSSHIYLVYCRPYCWDSTHESVIIGIFTTFTLAVEAAREWRTHIDDEWTISETQLNRHNLPITPIWSHDADDGNKSIMSCYQSYWRAGYPENKNPKELERN